ncbi:MAG: APC family permease [Acidobacteria bacterium]|nr:APC family permease [Acidobacteriota bacterium]
MMDDRSKVEQPRLAQGAIGVVGQVFQSISHMAPAAGVIFSAQYMATKGGASLTLAWIIATIACLLTAASLKEVVRKVHGAGGYFVIISASLGHFVGFTTSWLWFLFEPMVPAGLGMLLGYAVSDFLFAEIGIFVPWWPVAILMIVALTYVSYLGIRESSRATVIFGSLEIAIMLLLAVVLIVKAGPRQPLSSFTPDSSPLRWGGVFFATIYGVLGFLGFEAGIPLAEEDENARRSLSIAIMTSTLGMGLFYCVLGYGTVAGWGGFENPSRFAAGFSGAVNPYFALGRRAFGAAGPWLVLFVIANAAIACSIAAQNAATRVYYSLARAGIFPGWLNHIHPRTRTPDRAIFTQGCLSILFTLLLGFTLGPFNGYGLLGLIYTIALMIIYITTNVACFALYFFQYRREFRVFAHLVVPALGTLVMLAPLAAAFIPELLFGKENKNVYPYTLGPRVAVVWFVIGLLFYAYLRKKRPEGLRAMTNEVGTAEAAGIGTGEVATVSATAPL